MSDLSKLPQAANPCIPGGTTDQRGKDAFEVRFGTATKEAVASGSVSHSTNGDEARYKDKSATYTKCLKQDSPGVVNPAAFRLFKAALKSGNPTDFEKAGLIGAGRPLNGPLGAFALTLVGGDSQIFGDSVVPLPPRVASPQYATELVELYWASLLRDIAFTDYATNGAANAAAMELNALKSSYAGPRDAKGNVTPSVLFRGGFGDPAKSNFFFGENYGPYISQLCIRPTMLGAQPIDQKMSTLAAGINYLTNLDAWQAIQNGVMPLAPPLPGDKNRYMHTGRSLAAFTHIDELYQAYFTAYLVIETLYPNRLVIQNPGSPYVAFKNQQPFGTFGGPDIAATLAAVSRAALSAVWYQKWIVHLRHRPESGGGIVQLIKTGHGANILKKTGGGNDTLHDNILSSMALEQSLVENGSYLLSQAFPEGSPAHPAYPTGHGTVAGACITVLKFFYNGDSVIPNPVVPSADGLTLEPYTGADAGKMSLNGELHKLAHNISFGHGIHAGIHWRSDTDFSILLGEAVAIKFLQDQAFTYRENFAISFKKIDGTLVTISNY